MFGPTLLPPRTDSLDTGSIQAYFSEGWSLNEALFATLAREDAFYLQPEPLRHPLIFYYGHTAAFFVNKLRLAGLCERSLSPRLETLLARGVDPACAGELVGYAGWPSVEEVTAFRTQVRTLVGNLIDCVAWPARMGWDDPLWALLMAMEHDRIHFETSSVLFRQMPLSALTKPGDWEEAPEGTPPEEKVVDVAGGTVQLGKERTNTLYGWDNEYGSVSIEVAPFQTTAHLVTNGAFKNFVAQGGYETSTWWTEAGWAWRKTSGAEAPRFWTGHEGALRLRTLFAERPLPEDWPVEVNAHEAEAYCRWRGDGWRLPTEAEHAAMCREIPLRDGDILRDGFNVDLCQRSPTSVAHSQSYGGLHDLHGNVWQWLSDAFRPLPGFRPHPLYEDFSLPYFDAQHAMLAGSSFATTGTGSSRFYRLWFRRHFAQHAGFRLARSRC